MTVTPTFSSVREAAEVVRAGLGFLAAADATQLAAATQAHCLQVPEQATLQPAHVSVWSRPRD